MKKFKHLIAIAAMFLCIFNTKAQVDTIFYENFDTLPSAWQMLRSNIPVQSTQLFQLETVVTRNQSFGAATDTVGNRTESYLTSPLIDIRGYVEVQMSFEQICYIEPSDAATIQISIDTGATWQRLPSYSYLGSSFYDWGQGGFKFTKFSSQSVWPNTLSNFVYQSNTTEWINEEFTLDSILMQSPTEAIMLRLALIDDVTGAIGSTGTHRWIVDDFTVTAQRIVGLNSFNNQDNLKLNLYPNPANDWFYIENNNAVSLEVNLRDVKGKLVATKLTNSDRKQKIDISNLKSGIYFVDVRSKQATKTFKLIKH